jgi:hypothetical protein
MDREPLLSGSVKVQRVRTDPPTLRFNDADLEPRLIARGFTLQGYPQVTFLKSPMAMTWKPRNRLAEIA